MSDDSITEESMSDDLICIGSLEPKPKEPNRKMKKGKISSYPAYISYILK